MNVSPRNISIIMHSYVASLFNSNFILVRPIEEMGEILVRNFPDLLIVDTFQGLISCSDEFINNQMRIENGSSTYCIRITKELRCKFLERDDLEFNFSRLF